MGFFDSFKQKKLLRTITTAIEADDPQMLGELLDTLAEKNRLDRLPPDTLLFTCSQGNRAECARLLLEKGEAAALTQTDPMGRFPLHLAVENGDLDTVRVLLDAGADANVRDKDGVTPLNLCKSFHGTTDIALLLQKAGGNPNLVDKHGKNYLM